VGAAVSILGWVLVGLVIWVVVALVTALVLARLLRANRRTTLDLLQAHHRLETDPLTVPEVEESCEDLPAPRDSAHDDAEGAVRRRPPRG
jgi:hypothetical protein